MLSVVLTAATLAGLLTLGCAGNAADAPSSSEGQLQQDETVIETYVSRMHSKTPGDSGVDEWDLSLISKAGGGTYLVAIGYSVDAEDRRTDRLEVVTDDGKTVLFRDPSPDQSLSMTPLRIAAVGADFQAMLAELDQTVQAPATGQSVRISSNTVPNGCKSDLIMSLTAGVLAVTSAGVTGVVCTAGDVLTLGLAVPGCVAVASVTVFVATQAVQIGKNAKMCIDASKVDGGHS